MGDVYAAFDTLLERRVALKFIIASEATTRSMQARIRREARLASALKHHGIVTIFEIGEFDAQVFIAMELVEGETLANLMKRRGRLPPSEAVLIIRQIGEALGVAHNAGILHRDIKPSNVMMDERGLPRLLDFGLAKRYGVRTPPAGLPIQISPALDITETDLGDEAPRPRRRLPEAKANAQFAPIIASSDATPSTPIDDEQVTAVNERVGTPGYVAAEVIRGELPDRRTDLFALGVLLYQLLAGKKPFNGQSVAELAPQVFYELYRLPSDYNQDVGSELDAVVIRCLRARRQQRFPTVEAMISAAEAALRAGAMRHRSSVRKRLGVLILVFGLAFIIAVIRFVGERSERPEHTAVSLTIRDIPTNGCGYAPLFVSDTTIAYIIGETNHVQTLSFADNAAYSIVDFPVRVLPDSSLSHGRRDDELIYVGSSAKKSCSQCVATLTLTTGQVSKLAPGPANDVLAIHDAIYYLTGELQSLQNLERSADPMPLGENNRPRISISGRATGPEVASVMTDMPMNLCISSSITSAPVICAVTPPLTTTHPAWSPKQSKVYFPSSRGITSFDALTYKEETPIGDVTASGGLDISKDGEKLVYSDCVANSLIMSNRPDSAPIAVPGQLGTVVVGPKKRIAYSVRGINHDTLYVQASNGSIKQVDCNGTRIREVALSPDGQRIAVSTSIGLEIYSIPDEQLLPPNYVSLDGRDSGLMWRDNGVLLYSCVRERRRRLCELDIQEERFFEMPEPVQMLVGVLTRNRLLVGANDDTFYAWDLLTNALIKLPVSDSLVASSRLALSPNGRWLAYTLATDPRSVYTIDILRNIARPSVAVDSQWPISDIAVDDDGYVYYAKEDWSGGMHLVDARKGTSF